MIKATLLAALSSALLSACGSVTPAGLMAAARLDPLETPPAALAVAVSVPQGVRLQDGDAVLRLAFQPEDPAQAEAVGIEVPLSVRADPSAPEATVSDDLVYVLQLNARDAARMADAQRQIIALRAAEVAGQGSLGIEVTGGCLISTMPDTFPVATWLRPKPAGDWVPLTRRRDLLNVLPAAEANALLGRLERC